MDFGRQLYGDDTLLDYISITISSSAIVVVAVLAGNIVRGSIEQTPRCQFPYSWSATQWLGFRGSIRIGVDGGYLFNVPREFGKWDGRLDDGGGELFDRS